MKQSYKFFTNTDCRYFPCHSAPAADKFNCLFCYCPLYLLGDRCGGNFRFVGPRETVKDCSACSLPHHPDYYDEILKRLMAATVKE